MEIEKLYIYHDIKVAVKWLTHTIYCFCKKHIFTIIFFTEALLLIIEGVS